MSLEAAVKCLARRTRVPPSSEPMLNGSPSQPSGCYTPSANGWPSVHICMRLTPCAKCHAMLDERIARLFRNRTV
jgi:hypothetical protein